MLKTPFDRNIFQIGSGMRTKLRPISVPVCLAAGLLPHDRELFLHLFLGQIKLSGSAETKADMRLGADGSAGFQMGVQPVCSLTDNELPVRIELARHRINVDTADVLDTKCLQSCIRVLVRLKLPADPGGKPLEFRQIIPASKGHHLRWINGKFYIC